MIAKNTVCLWFDGNIGEAAEFYCATLPETRITARSAAPSDYPGGKSGDPITISLTIMGIPTLLLSGGPEFSHNEAFSFQIATDDQEETDRLWNAIVGNGGQESQCGWCKDKWGISWQITPRALTEAMSDPDPEAARRTMQAMMTMKKIDIAAIKTARAGNGE